MVTNLFTATNLIHGDMTVATYVRIDSASAEEVGHAYGDVRSSGHG